MNVPTIPNPAGVAMRVADLTALNEDNIFAHEVNAKLACDRTLGNALGPRAPGINL